jgi:hypothetical protein
MLRNSTGIAQKPSNTIPFKTCVNKQKGARLSAATGQPPKNDVYLLLACGCHCARNDRHAASEQVYVFSCFRPNEES